MTTDIGQPLVGQIRSALQQVRDPEIRRPITDLGMVDEIQVNEQGYARVKVLLTVAGCPLHTTIRQDVTEAVSQVPGVSGVDVEIGVMTPEQRAALTQMLRGGAPEREIPFTRPDSLTQVLAVASGKGGVGKSSVTVNLALALAAKGLNVGLLDADIYGHSIPDLLGIPEARPTIVDDMIMPVPALGLKVISMGMLKQSRDQVIAWRGPLLDRALTQLLTDVYWGDLDWFLIDLPPGTGDVAMSIGQKLPGSQVVVVTTPQPTVAEVSERAGTMASMLHQSVIGVVENMSWFDTVCPTCHQQHRVEIFGSGGGQRTADALSQRLGREVPLLAQVPMDLAVMTGGESGSPVMITDPDLPSAQALRALADRLASTRPSLAGRPLGLQVH